MKKKIVAVLVCVLLLLSFTSCAVPEDEVIASLGEYEKGKHFASDDFQEQHADYAKYYYTSLEIEDNKYFKQIQESDFAKIKRHLDDFEAWLATIEDAEPWNEVVRHYDFDREIVDIEDYFYIDSEEVPWTDGTTVLVNYTVYLFDAQTQVLYYFYNNMSL